MIYNITLKGQYLEWPCGRLLDELTYWPFVLDVQQFEIHSGQR